MATFYKVKDEMGKAYVGVSEIKDTKALKKSLLDHGWYIIRIAPFKEKRGVFFRKKVDLESLAIFTHQLSSMLEVGIPILRALDILWRQIDNLRLQIVVSQIKERLESGSSLFESFSRFPDVFSPIYLALLGVAEIGAGLVAILHKLTEYINNQRMFISKIKRATTYPLIVVGFAVLVVIGMLIWIIPTFQTVFTRMRVELPFLTQLILKISSLMHSVYFWLSAFLVLLLSFISYKRFSATSIGRYKIDSLKLKLPLFGSFFYTTSVARFVRSLNLLIAAGLPIDRGIEATKAVVINKRIAKSLDSVRESIAKGETFSKALAKTRIFPPLLIQMVSVGEESGTLVEMLERLSLHFEEELDYRINKFLTAIEPLLIIFVGGIVVFILLSVYLPIFRVWQELGGLR